MLVMFSSEVPLCSALLHVVYSLATLRLMRDWGLSLVISPGRLMTNNLELAFGSSGYEWSIAIRV